MTGVVILLSIIQIFLLWPRIMRWLQPAIQRWMMRRMENYVRKAAGMPPRDNSRKNSRTRSGRQNEQGYQKRDRHRRQHTDGPIIPKEYAEDVEFTETVEYSSDRSINPGATKKHQTSVRMESQVSDAEWEEV